MPTRIKRAGERIVISKLAISLVRILAVELDHGVRDADDVMLILAAFVGQAERKPMTPAKLAMYAGLARPTAIRRLQKLKDAGLVQVEPNGTVICPREMLNHPQMMEAVNKAARAIHRAAAELSKMDSVAIAAPAK